MQFIDFRAVLNFIASMGRLDAEQLSNDDDHSRQVRGGRYGPGSIGERERTSRFRARYAGDNGKEHHHKKVMLTF